METVEQKSAVAENELAGRSLGGGADSRGNWPLEVKSAGLTGPDEQNRTCAGPQGPARQWPGCPREGQAAVQEKLWPKQ